MNTVLHVDTPKLFGLAYPTGMEGPLTLVLALSVSNAGQRPAHIQRLMVTLPDYLWQGREYNLIQVGKYDRLDHRSPRQAVQPFTVQPGSSVMLVGEFHRSKADIQLADDGPLAVIVKALVGRTWWPMGEFGLDRNRAMVVPLSALREPAPR